MLLLNGCLLSLFILLWKLLDTGSYLIFGSITTADTTYGLTCGAGHPHFFNQLSCGLDLVSMAGEWLTATANTNMFTYEIAPVFILMEHVVMEKMREIIGFQGGDSILAPGNRCHEAVSHHKHTMYRVLVGRIVESLSCLMIKTGPSGGPFIHCVEY
jgi:hypothetical protein